MSGHFTLIQSQEVNAYSHKLPLTLLRGLAYMCVVQDLGWLWESPYCSSSVQNLQHALLTIHLHLLQHKTNNTLTVHRTQSKGHLHSNKNWFPPQARLGTKTSATPACVLTFNKVGDHKTRMYNISLFQQQQKMLYCCWPLLSLHMPRSIYSSWRVTGELWGRDLSASSNSMHDRALNKACQEVPETHMVPVQTVV